MVLTVLSFLIYKYVVMNRRVDLDAYMAMDNYSKDPTKVWDGQFQRI